MLFLALQCLYQRHDGFFIPHSVAGARKFRYLAEVFVLVQPQDLLFSFLKNFGTEPRTGLLALEDFILVKKKG